MQALPQASGSEPLPDDHDGCKETSGHVEAESAESAPQAEEGN